MAEHTELPWRAERVSRFDEYDVCGKNGEQVAACYVTDGADEPHPIPAPANAAFIVKAVNSHVGLLELAAEAMWRRDYPNGGSVYKTYDSLNYADKELHRAEALKAALLAAREVKP